MLYAIVPVTHRKGVSAAAAMAAVTGNATDKTGTVVTVNIMVTANTAVIAAMGTTMDTANITNTAVTAIIMSTTKATVVTKAANTVVTAVAGKACAVCLIMVTCVL